MTKTIKPVHTSEAHLHPYRLYGLRPDRRFIGTADSMDEARERCISVVSGHYEHAEVWYENRPVFAAWKDGPFIKDTERNGGGR